MTRQKCENFRWWAEAVMPECVQCKDPVKNCPVKKFIEYLIEYVDECELRKMVKEHDKIYGRKR